MRHRRAAKDARKDKRETKDTSKGHSAPKIATNISMGKDAQVEELEGELDAGDVEKVQRGEDVEVVAKVLDLLELEGPDVLAEAVVDTADEDDGGAGGLNDGREEDGPVVEAEVQILADELSDEA